jgi:exoribonuclease-2
MLSRPIRTQAARHGSCFAYTHHLFTGLHCQYPCSQCHIHSGGQADHGILLCETRLVNNRHLFRVLTKQGQISAVTREDVTYVYPTFVDPDHVRRIGDKISPTSRSELMARVTAVKKMRDFYKAYQDVYNGMAGRFYALYDTLAPKDPEAWGEISVPEVMRLKGFDVNNRLAFLATQNHLMDRETHFLPHQTNFLANQTFHVLPRARVARLQSFREKVASDTDFLPSFARRARRIIDALDARRAAHEHGAPSVREAADITFSADDRLIIDILRDGQRLVRGFQDDPYPSLGFGIMKAVGRHGDVVQRDDMFQLLVDLGVFAPWQDSVSRRWDVVSKDHGGIPGPRDAVAVQRLSARTTLAPDEFYPMDPAAAIRHDFGALTAYVIDDATARELDDGLSVERATDAPGHIWVHVHIADPTRLLHPEHTIARKAARAEETTYFVNRAQPMLPEDFVRDNGLSLGTASAEGRPEHVMTFSAKIAPDGAIVDCDVRAGLVRSVRLLKYDDVDAAMGWEGTTGTYPFGGAAAAGPTPAALSAREREELELLREVERRRVRYFRASDAWYSTPEHADISVTPFPLPASAEAAAHPAVYGGFPDVRWKVLDAAPLRGARSVIAECAKMASMAASMFAGERGVPLIRRAQRSPAEINEPETIARLLAARDDAGFVPTDALLRTPFQYQSAYATLSADGHWAVGCPAGVGYVRVSSPLRRYTDMLHHWQLKHALLHPGAPPLFAAAELQALIAHPVALQRPRFAEKAHRREWAALLVRRYAAAHPERVGGDGPGPLQSVDVVVSTPGPQVRPDTEDVVDVLVPRLGLSAWVLVDKNREYPELVLGSRHRVDLVEARSALSGRLIFRLRQ